MTANLESKTNRYCKFSLVHEFVGDAKWLYFPGIVRYSTTPHVLLELSLVISTGTAGGGRVRK